MTALDRAQLDGAAPLSNRLLTPVELADRWGVPKSQVYRLAREGRVPAVWIGRYVRFRPAEVEAFEAAGGVSP